jgi:hypothetical protein
MCVFWHLALVECVSESVECLNIVSDIAGFFHGQKIFWCTHFLFLLQGCGMPCYFQSGETSFHDQSVISRESSSWYHVFK